MERSVFFKDIFINYYYEKNSDTNIDKKFHFFIYNAKINKIINLPAFITF